MRTFLSDWRNTLPIAGLGALAVTGLYYFLRPKRVDPDAMERERRSYLNRVGRIVEGLVVDVLDEAGFSAHNAQHSSSVHSSTGKEIALPATTGAQSGETKPVSKLEKSPAHGAAVGGIPKLLYYSYSISGVTYETAQDITGLEERVHLSRIASGQTASVKYDPSNPSNSILLADDWSGLH
ncbi:MAG: hypothetical protein ABSA57_09335 [Candidatus Acidiferrales bacterium]